MLDNFFRKRVTDKHFGDIEVTKDKESGTFYLEKTMDFGPRGKIELWLENQTTQTTQEQFDLYNLIRDNYTIVLRAAQAKYFDSYKRELFEEYDLESISLNDNDTTWDLWLLKKDSFENCLVTFDKLEVQGVSFQA